MEFQEDQRDRSNALAGPLVDQTQCAKFIICLTIFNDIRYSMGQLSMAFQKDHVQWAAVLRQLSSTREALTAQYIEEPFIGGPSYRALREHADAAMAAVTFNPLVAEPVPFSHRGVTMPTVDAYADYEIQTGVKEYATEILADLDGRFPDVPLFTVLQIFDFAEMPSEGQWATCKGTWGDAELKQLTEHFGVPKVSVGPLGKTHNRVVDPILAKAQWESFKNQLYALKQQGLSLEDGYAEILRSDILPDIKRLACIFRVLCLSTAWCERGFSLENHCL
jgi:hypothetical protein